MMDLPSGTRLAYNVRHEAWYWTALEGTDRRAIEVLASHGGGGVAWEFAVEEHPNVGIRLGLFDDAWDAFTQLPEFFEALAAMPERPSLEDVRGVLDKLGAIDETTREQS